MTGAQGPGVGPEPPREDWPAVDLEQRLAGAAAELPAAELPAADPAELTQPPAAPAASVRSRLGGLGGVLGAVRNVLGAPLRLIRRRFPWFTLRSRRGKLLAVFMVAAFASTLTVGGVIAVQWTETADFCGRCHTMGPELKAHAISPHRELECAECHVEPGVDGWVKAKLNGTRQLVQLITGTFPTPIPPPGHGDLPPTSSTCRRCHDAEALVNDGLVKLLLSTRFDADIGNSRSTVAMVLRPTGFGGSNSLGVHWHIDLDVEYSTTDRRAQSIEVVTVTGRDGITIEYIANRDVTRADRVQQDIDRLVAENPLQRMDCIDCHNRIGHRVPSLNEAVDTAMAAGLIDPSLPSIKREALDKLSAEYATTAEAEAAIDGITDFYRSQYPVVASYKPETLSRAVEEIKIIYNLVATPEMRVSASTYPDNLGHKDYPGCFRCHDGAHFKVKNGLLTKEAIASTCATCHTFPQIGSGTTSFLIGARPDTHSDRFWLFGHKTLAASSDPSKNTCAACHTQTYCQNCHNSPTINVPHDNMMYSHPAVIQKLGGMTNCALCHQPTSCEKCHPKGVVGFSSTPAATSPPH